MPEGPEIKCSTIILKNAIEGMYIKEVNFAPEFARKNLITKETLLQDLPLKIDEVVARAKRVNFICTNSNNEGSAIIWFYALQGRLCFKPRGKFHVEMILAQQDGKEITRLYYEDVINLGFMKYATTVEQIEKIYSNIGPDFTNDEVTLEMFTKGIDNKRLKNKPIADFLLDQKRFSGIGNYLRAEILYDAKINPNTTLSELIESKRVTVLYNSIIKIMNDAISCGGMTSRNYMDPNDNIGKFKAEIYNKTHDKFGNEILQDKLGNIPKGKDTRRVIWWCPTIQL